MNIGPNPIDPSWVPRHPETPTHVLSGNLHPGAASQRTTGFVRKGLLCVWRRCRLVRVLFWPLEQWKKGPPGWLGYIGDEILPRYIGIIINHYKDPYKPTRIQWKVIFGFFSWLTWSGSSTESMASGKLTNMAMAMERWSMNEDVIFTIESMGILQPAMSLYRSVTLILGCFEHWTPVYKKGEKPTSKNYLLCKMENHLIYLYDVYHFFSTDFHSGVSFCGGFSWFLLGCPAGT